MNYHECLGEDCKRMITYRFALCRECEKTYGSSPLGWPAWMRFLWNEEQRERRRERNRNKMEVNMDMETIQEMIDEDNSPWIITPREEND